MTESYNRVREESGPQSFRNERIASLIQEKIGALIVFGKIKDPRVDSFLSVTRVEVAGDLSTANVHISSWKTDKGLETGVAGLNNAASFIQRELARTLKTRQTPKLRFHADPGLKEEFDLVRKIDGIINPAGDAAANDNGAAQTQKAAPGAALPGGPDS